MKLFFGKDYPCIWFKKKKVPCTWVYRMQTMSFLAILPVFFPQSNHCYKLFQLEI